jgi:hypothetical protein
VPGEAPCRRGADDTISAAEADAERRLLHLWVVDSHATINDMGHHAVIPYPLFAQALESGSLKRIENLASEMPAIRLGDALRIVELMARDGDPRYERAARRWLDRLAAETELDRDDAEVARACLLVLPHRAEAIDDLRRTVALR